MFRKKGIRLNLSSRFFENGFRIDDIYFFIVANFDLN